MNYTRQQIGEFVKAHRKVNNITQVELSENVGISQSKISKVEKGNLDLSVSEFVRILKVFGIELEMK